jgi:hypothetical protein
MDDTSSENRELVRDAVMSKSVEERFFMCAAMYEDAKALAMIGMPTGLSDEEQKAYIFRRLHGADPEEFVQSEWLRIVYSGFWDYPFGFVVEFEGDVYVFLRGDFDEELDDYSTEYEIIRDNSIDMTSMRKNFSYTGTGDVVGRVDMRQLRFDPSHREEISSKVFIDLGLKK